MTRSVTRCPATTEGGKHRRAPFESITRTAPAEPPRTVWAFSLAVAAAVPALPAVAVTGSVGVGALAALLTLGCISLATLMI